MPGIVFVFGDTVVYEIDRSPVLWYSTFRIIIMILNNLVSYGVDITGLSLHVRKLRHRNSFLQVTLVARIYQLYWYRQDDTVVLITAYA